MISNRGEDMKVKRVGRIKFEDLGLSPKERLKLPCRRELSSKPWDEDQMRAFMERQKHVPEILAAMGIIIKGTTTYAQAKAKREKEIQDMSSQKDS